MPAIEILAYYYEPDQQDPLNRQAIAQADRP
jgi:hypothetical protein